MLKIAMFKDAKQYAEWANREADLIEAHGLRQTREWYEEELRGIGKESWLKSNNIPEEKWEEMWEHRLEWRRGQIKSLERKIRKYRRDAQKALQAV